MPPRSSLSSGNCKIRLAPPFDNILIDDWSWQVTVQKNFSSFTVTVIPLRRFKNTEKNIKHCSSFLCSGLDNCSLVPCCSFNVTVALTQFGFYSRFVSLSSYSSRVAFVTPDTISSRWISIPYHPRPIPCDNGVGRFFRMSFRGLLQRSLLQQVNNDPSFPRPTGSIYRPPIEHFLSFTHGQYFNAKWIFLLFSPSGESHQKEALEAGRRRFFNLLHNRGEEMVRSYLSIFLSFRCLIKTWNKDLGGEW